MKRAILIATLLAGLATEGPAFAQSPEHEPQSGPADSVTSVLNVSRDWRVTKLVGSSLTNMQDQTVGKIEDVVVDNDGKVVSVLVSVGGFLGLGKRQVAVAFKDLLISRAEDGDPIVKITLSKQALETAPDMGVNE